MKIERLNERQIRCTLTGQDLAERKIKLSEFTYGTDKTRQLFQDMMEQASYEVGFDTEDLPLMIEAVPLNAECIVLVITKVEDPEELDTRFANFAPSVREEIAEEGGGEYGSAESQAPVKADEVLGMFRRLQSEGRKNASEDDSVSAPDINISRVYAFRSMPELFRLSSIVGSSFTGGSSLYRDAEGDRYLLRISKDDMPIEDFNRYCNMVSEYGNPLHGGAAGDACMMEHCKPLLPEDALLLLSEI